MRKRSGFLTNHVEIATNLNRTCHGDHDHEHIVGRAPGDMANRSRTAQQRYPQLLIQCILGTYAASIGLNASELHHAQASTILDIDEQLTKKFHINSLAVGDAVQHGVEDEVLPDVGLDECHVIDDKEPGGDHDTATTVDFPDSHPLSLPALVKRAHEGLGHPGQERCFRILKSTSPGISSAPFAKSSRSPNHPSWRPSKRSRTQRGRWSRLHSNENGLLPENKILFEHV